MPANDDAGRAIALYCDLIARAAIDGISRGQGGSGVDLGAAETPMAEELPAAANAQAGVELLSAPRGAPDDFMKLPGVGPDVVKKLNDGGLFHFWQIARDDAGRRGRDRRAAEARRPHHPRGLGGHRPEPGGSLIRASAPGAGASG